MSLRPVFLCWLLLALVLTPALGLVHGVLHGGRVPHAQTQPQGHQTHAAEGAEQAFADGVSMPLAGWLVERLVPAHGDVPDCRVYDQQTHGDLGTGTPLLVLPAVAIGFTLRHRVGAARARLVAFFDARGPPACA